MHAGYSSSCITAGLWHCAHNTEPEWTTPGTGICGGTPCPLFSDQLRNMSRFVLSKPEAWGPHGGTVVITGGFTKALVESLFLEWNIWNNIWNISQTSTWSIEGVRPQVWNRTLIRCRSDIFHNFSPFIETKKLKNMSSTFPGGRQRTGEGKKDKLQTDVWFSCVVCQVILVGRLRRSYSKIQWCFCPDL